MASNKLATLSPFDIQVVISHAESGIVHTVVGFAEDQMVDVEQSQARFEMYTGGDDFNTRVFKNNSSGVVTLHIQQSSPSNDILSFLLENDLNTRDSSGLFSFLIKDNSGRSSYYAEEAYIANIPNAGHGTSMNLRDWTIHAPKMKSFVGGNVKLSDADIAAIEALGGTVDPKWQNG